MISSNLVDSLLREHVNADSLLPGIAFAKENP